MPRRGFMRIMPSGRAIRLVEPSLSDYTKANDGAKDLDALIRNLLPRILTGITLAPVPEIKAEPVVIPPTPEQIAAAAAAGEDPPEPREETYLDEPAMTASAESGAAGGWHELTYLSLREKNKDGVAFVDTLFEYEVADFLDLKTFIVEVLFGGKKSLPPRERRTPIKTTT